MRNTKIVTCSCHHAFQNKRYGDYKRVANITADGKRARCTVCKREHTS